TNEVKPRESLTNPNVGRPRGRPTHSVLPRLRRDPRAAVEDVHQLRNSAIQRLGKSNQHPERRRCPATLQVADEGLVGPRTLRQLRLRHPPREPKLAQSRPEDLAFRRCQRLNHSILLTIRLTV